MPTGHLTHHEREQRERKYDVPLDDITLRALFDLSQRKDRLGDCAQKIWDEVHTSRLATSHKHRRSSKDTLTLSAETSSVIPPEYWKAVTAHIETERICYGETTPRVQEFLRSREQFDKSFYAQKSEWQHEAVAADMEPLTEAQKKSSLLYQELEPLVADIAKELGFTRPVRLEITRNPQMNAFVLAADKGQEEFAHGPLRFYVNAGLITALQTVLKAAGKTLTQEHVLFVLGHELRHLRQQQYFHDVSGRSPEVTQRYEYDADAASLEANDRAGNSPRAGIEVMGLLNKVKNRTEIVQHYLTQSHPMSENRVKALLKDFHRPDHPYVSADKPLTPLSEEALKDAEWLTRAEWSKKIQEAETCKDWEEVLETYEKDPRMTEHDAVLVGAQLRIFTEVRQAYAIAEHHLDTNTGLAKSLLYLINAHLDPEKFSVVQNFLSAHHGYSSSPPSPRAVYYSSIQQGDAPWSADYRKEREQKDDYAAHTAFVLQHGTEQKPLEALEFPNTQTLFDPANASAVAYWRALLAKDQSNNQIADQHRIAPDASEQDVMLHAKRVCIALLSPLIGEGGSIRRSYSGEQAITAYAAYEEVLKQRPAPQIETVGAFDIGKLGDILKQRVGGYVKPVVIPEVPSVKVKIPESKSFGHTTKRLQRPVILQEMTYTHPENPGLQPTEKLLARFQKRTSSIIREVVTPYGTSDSHAAYVHHRAFFEPFFDSDLKLKDQKATKSWEAITTKNISDHPEIRGLPITLRHLNQTLKRADNSPYWAEGNVALRQPLETPLETTHDIASLAQRMEYGRLCRYHPLLAARRVEEHSYHVWKRIAEVAFETTKTSRVAILQERAETEGIAQEQYFPGVRTDEPLSYLDHVRQLLGRKTRKDQQAESDRAWHAGYRALPEVLLEGYCAGVAEDPSQMKSAIDMTLRPSVYASEDQMRLPTIISTRRLIAATEHRSLQHSDVPKTYEAARYFSHDLATMQPSGGGRDADKLLDAVWLEQVEFELAQLPQDGEIIKIRAFLKSGLPKKIQAGQRALKEYAIAHPEIEKIVPALAVYRVLPDEFIAKIIHKSYSVYVLSMGWMPQSAEAESALLDIEHPEQFIAYFQAAEALHGARWEEKDPENYRLLTNLLARIEWERLNPILTTSEAKKILHEFLQIKGDISDIARGSEGFDWPYFIKTLIEQPEVMRERLIEMPFVSNNEYQVLIFNDQDPDFQNALEEVGRLLAERFAPDDPQYQTRDGRLKLVEELRAREGIPIEGTLRAAYVRGARQAQWNGILGPLREQLMAVVKSPDAAQRLSDLLPRFFREFLLYRAWAEQPDRSHEVAEQFLDLMGTRVPEGARASRAQDVMNQNVRDLFSTARVEQHKKARRALFEASFTPEEKQIIANSSILSAGFQAYIDGTFSGQSQENLVWDQGFQIEHTRDGVNVRRQDKSGEYKSAVHLAIDLTPWKTSEVAAWQADKNRPGPHDLRLYTDGMLAGDKGDATFNKSGIMPIVCHVMEGHMMHIAEAVHDPQRAQPNLSAIDTWIMQRVPEACALRDQYLENILHLRIWNWLQQSRVAQDLEKLHVSFTTRELDLGSYFTGRDKGTLHDAYMTRYTLFRVEGLQGLSDVLTESEKAELADILHAHASRMTAPSREVLDRIAIELEHHRYDELYEETLEKTGSSDKALHALLAKIETSFPMPTTQRDELLERLAVDMARTSEQARTIEERTHAYLVRQPHLEQTHKKKDSFTPAEAIKNYFTTFGERQQRGEILAWVFGGNIPEDRFIEGDSFGVNSDIEKEAFWTLSDHERRELLYTILLGEKGLFDTSTDFKTQSAWQQGEEQKLYQTFLKEFFTHQIEGLVEGEDEKAEKLKTAMRVIFFETFQRYAPARRVELFQAITKKIRDLRLKQEKLTAPQAIRLFLEQVGVVGIKAGQVLAEQEGMLPDDIKQELSGLRDKATPFSKFGVFTLTKLNHLETATEASPGIKEIGRCVGSASIKQGHIVLCTDGTAAVEKLPRPSIDKNFTEDAEVLSHVFEALRTNGFDIPNHLLPQIVSSCKEEFDFHAEAEAQQEIGANLAARSATIQTSEGRYTLMSPRVIREVRKGDLPQENLQALVDEYIPGLSLADLERYLVLHRKAETARTVQEHHDYLEIRENVQRIYGERAPKALYAYEQMDPKEIRAQLALDLLAQITQDGRFHADLHAGNVLIDAGGTEPRVAMIDFGSSGTSVDKPAFTDFMRQLLFLRGGMGGDVAALGRILHQFTQVPDMTEELWAQKVQALHTANEAKAEGFFKGLLSAVFSQQGQVEPNFRLLLKSLASAGGHFDALGGALREKMLLAAARAQTEQRNVIEILFEYPGYEKIANVLAAS